MLKVDDQQLKAFLIDSGLLKEKPLQEADIIAKKLGKKLDDVQFEQ